jgi:hypothetical protein
MSSKRADLLMKELLEELAKDDPHLRNALKKVADTNPLENSMWSNMLDGALKAVEVVSVATFDAKLLVIVKLFQSWLSDKREELKKSQQDRLKGVNYNLTHPQFQVTPSGGYDYGGRPTW